MNDIVILVACLRDMDADNIPFVFSDRTATLEAADFSVDLDRLDELPWELWQSSDFRRDDARPDKIERYLAEALIHKRLQVTHLKSVVCWSEERRVELEKLIKKQNLQVPVYCRPGWYC
jgi:ssDNA thymidine ADP-ribosyltransferase, DarT